MDYARIIELLSGLDERISALENELSNPDVSGDIHRLERITREYKRIRKLLELSEQFRRITEQISDDEQIAEGGDDELAQIAQEELPHLREEAERLERKILSLLAPPDPNDGRPVIVEIRAGTGGEEAALFVADLLRMYSRFAEEHGWNIEIIDANPTDIGGYREIVFTISGEDAYRLMRFESGVHRVQRIPITESGGRIHTSASSVAVLPQVPEEDVDIKPEELKIDTFRASGAGGQHVNKVESAVRITHIPTGTVVTCQAERSQHKNRMKAMQILKSKIADIMRREAEDKIDSARRNQVGSGDRSEKIRTYNFPQNRITDHRIGYTAYNLQSVMDGQLDELFNALQSAWAEQMLQKGSDL